VSNVSLTHRRAEPTRPAPRGAPQTPRITNRPAPCRSTHARSYQLSRVALDDVALAPTKSGTRMGVRAVDRRVPQPQGEVSSLDAMSTAGLAEICPKA
jgi:hypothetical protein